MLVHAFQGRVQKRLKGHTIWPNHVISAIQLTGRRTGRGIVSKSILCNFTYNLNKCGKNVTKRRETIYSYRKLWKCRTGNKAQLVKCSPYKHEDLNSVPDISLETQKHTLSWYLVGREDLWGLLDSQSSWTDEGLWQKKIQESEEQLRKTYNVWLLCIYKQKERIFYF